VSGRALPLPGGPGDRSPVEQVLRRAIELTDERFGTVAGTGVELGIEHLRQVTDELGLPPDTLAAAVAEHRVSAGLPPAGTLSRLVGPVAVVGWRHVEADSARTQALVVDWLEGRHALRVRRFADGTMVATRKPGVAGSVARTLRAARGGKELAGRGEVRASVVPEVDDTTTSVACMLVDLRSRRAGSVSGGSVLGAAGLAATAALGIAVAAPLAVVGVPLSLGAGLLTAAWHHRSVVRDVTEEVEITLDGVAQRERPTGAVRDLVRSVSSRRAELGRARG
jgi:hypothetical protein